MNGMYSASSVCTSACAAVPAPKCRANGSNMASDHPAATLPKWWCQTCGASSGISAIDSSMPAKGTPHSGPSAAPSISAAFAAPAQASSAITSSGR